MKRFSFTSDEIDANKATPADWHIFVRGREAEMAFSFFPGHLFPLALEIGAGDGAQSVTLAKHCRHLICTELDADSHSWFGQRILERQLENVEYRLCDAQDLSQFDDCSFDLIFSSNALEHIPDLGKCLGEFRRVLKPDGVMLHTMPNRWWRFISILFCIPALTRPQIHGVSSNYLAEFYLFGRRVWLSRFRKHGFRVDKTASFPFYMGHGNRFIPFIKLGNRMRLPASYLYIARKIEPWP